MKATGALRAALAVAAALWPILSAAQIVLGPKDAEPATREHNASILKQFPFDDRRDFDDAARGFIAALPDGRVAGGRTGTAWSIKQYDFEAAEEAPATVNPSLWREARLNAINGLFKVTERVYQLRGIDISNMTIIEGDTGLIVIDPLLAAETAKAALDLYYAHRPRLPVKTIVYTHSHIDHFGGVKGIVGDDDVRAGRVAIVAPDRFMDFATSENVIAGPAMRRRAEYQFGAILPPGPRGQVDAGLGKVTSRGTQTLIAPTQGVRADYKTHIVDGVEIEFHLVPESEAPSEMTLFFPQFGVLDIAEDAIHTMHNLYTLRGAEVRDGRLWAHYLDEAAARYGGRATALIAQHQWPIWDSERVTAFLEHQRDAYAFVHDQSVRLLDQGYRPDEIAERLKLPPSLEKDWAVHGYYGTLSHNAKGVYQKYLGWYDGNPANLAPLPQTETARREIAYMGGADAVIERAKKDFAVGDYRWVATVMNKVVFADPTNRPARELAADALEQLGYQAEAATWRNEYLTGAQELRNGVRKLPPDAAAVPDLAKAVPIDLLFDYLAVRLDGAKAEGKKIVINWRFPDVDTRLVLNLENAALTHRMNAVSDKADAGFTLTRPTLDAILTKQKTFADAIGDGSVTFTGDPRKLAQLFAMLDDFTSNFPIVEPLAR